MSKTVNHYTDTYNSAVKNRTRHQEFFYSKSGNNSSKSNAYTIQYQGNSFTAHYTVKNIYHDISPFIVRK